MAEREAQHILGNIKRKAKTTRFTFANSSSMEEIQMNHMQIVPQEDRNQKRMQSRQSRRQKPCAILGNKTSIMPRYYKI